MHFYWALRHLNSLTQRARFMSIWFRFWCIFIALLQWQWQRPGKVTALFPCGCKQFQKWWHVKLMRRYFCFCFSKSEVKQHFCNSRELQGDISIASVLRGCFQHVQSDLVNKSSKRTTVWISTRTSRMTEVIRNTLLLFIFFQLFFLPHIFLFHKCRSNKQKN